MLYANDPNNEYEPTLASDLLAIEAAISGAQPLTADRTVWVDSVSGNDGNAGTQVAPFQSFARAWAERQKYGVLRAKFTIRLLGVGPYTLPSRMGASLCGTDGYLIIRGDEAAEVQYAVGTFSGDFTGPTIATSAGLGSDTHKNRWVKITSGPAAGCVFMILKNTDTSITACNRRFKSAGSFTITAGTTFKVFTPGTQVICPSANGTRFDTWRGGELPSYQDLRHIWLNIAFTGTPGVLSSEVVFILCSQTTSIVVQYSFVSTYLMDSTIVGAAQHTYRSAGLYTPFGLNTLGGYVTGPFSCAGTSAPNLGTIVQQLGGRMGAINVGAQAQYELSTTGVAGDLGFRIEGTIAVQNAALLGLNSSGNLMEWAVTSGSCLRARRGGLIVADSATVTGGTTDPAGFGIDVTDGGQCFLRQPPALTGGTGGKDLKTTGNGGVANSVLSAAGTAAGVAADALLGEVLARVA